MRLISSFIWCNFLNVMCMSYLPKLMLKIFSTFFLEIFAFFKLQKGLIFGIFITSHTKVLVTMNMDLYKKALKLEHLNEMYSEKWMLSPGGFHIVVCALRCLGRTIEHSGLDEAWNRSLYSSTINTQIINVKHYNPAIQAHEITLEVLFNL